MTPQDIFDKLSENPEAWVGVAACRSRHEEPFQIRILEITTGVALLKWQKQRWQYEHALFDSYVMPGAQVATMLRDKLVGVGDERINFEGDIQAQRVERVQSRGSSHRQRLPWPGDEVQLSIFTNGNIRDPPSPLLSASGAPSFFTFLDAAAGFFWQGDAVLGGQLNPLAVWRHQDRRGRIASVTVDAKADTITTDVVGAEMGGLTLELASRSVGPSEMLAPPTKTSQMMKVTFDLNGGLPPASWLVLRSGDQWLDRRFLTYPYVNDELPDVHFVVDQTDRLEALVGTWERENVEFKRQLPSNDDEKRKIMKTVCAFANGQGGSILIGVDDETREYYGCKRVALDGIQQTLTQLVQAWVDPAPPIEFLALPIPDSELVILEMAVNIGSTLHMLGKSLTGRQPFVRHGSSSELPSRLEIISIVTTRHGSQIPLQMKQLLGGV